MKNIVFIFSVLLFCSCSNWQYKDITYDRCQHMEKIHVHFYHHQTCEWSCLNMEEGDYTYEDVFRIKYKVNNEGKITKVKLIK